MRSEEAFGKVLKELRVQKGLTQEQLAFGSNLDRTFISLLERGQRQPSLSSILTISECLGVPATDLVKKTVALLGKEK